MGYCFCKGSVYHPKPKTCGDCLIANDIIIGCGQGLKPCGDTTTINLNDYNHNPGDAVYSLVPGGYDPADFSSVTISPEGIVFVATGTNYTPHGLHEIEYMVVRGKYKNFGTLKICFDSPCINGCQQCNTCTGLCYGSTPPVNATATCGEADKTHNAATGLTLAACDGTTTWSVTAGSGINAVISNAGMITYDINGTAVPGQSYRITWVAECSLYGMSTTSYIDVLILDQCIGVVCPPDQVCNKCTGGCEEKESDMGTGGSLIGSSGPIVLTS